MQGDGSGTSAQQTATPNGPERILPTATNQKARGWSPLGRETSERADRTRDLADMGPSCGTYDPGPSRYGARNAVSAVSVSSGVSSATQWAQPGMTRVCTSSAASFIVFAT